MPITSYPATTSSNNTSPDATSVSWNWSSALTPHWNPVESGVLRQSWKPLIAHAASSPLLSSPLAVISKMGLRCLNVCAGVRDGFGVTLWEGKVKVRCESHKVKVLVALWLVGTHLTSNKLSYHPLGQFQHLV